MAQPRVFISSTYYDLKYVRSSLELFVESLGYEPVLSEKGGVAYSPDRPLDESCYREVQSCDIYVLIIGGRYGSEASSTRIKGISREFFDKFESITKLEYKAALDKDTPIYVLIEKAVYSEYQTYQKNRDSQNIVYAHADSINVYRFIDDILSQPRNNPIQTFDRYAEIEEWLRLQWAGLFRELMLRMSSQQQIASLASQVKELAEVNKTLRRYLEEVIAKVSPKDAAKIIHAESERLAVATLDAQLRGNDFISFLSRRGVPFEVSREALEKAETLADFKNSVMGSLPNQESARAQSLLRVFGAKGAIDDLNLARALVGKAPYPYEEESVVPHEVP